MNELSGAHPLPTPKAERTCNEKPDCHNGHCHGPTRGLGGKGRGLLPGGLLDLIGNEAKDEGQAERNDDQVVEVAQDRNEVGVEVDRAECIGRDQKGQPASKPWPLSGSP